MATPRPSPTSTAASGLADSSWIADVRRSLDDQPFWQREEQNGDGVNGILGAGAVPFRISRPPAYDTGTSLYVSVGGVAQTVISTGTPTSGQVLVNYENGELTFGTVPVAGSYNVKWSYQKVKWTDQSIENALYAGLRAMFPKVGKEYSDTSLTIQPLKWDYQLPSWAQSPGSEVYGIEVQDSGISVLPFKPIRSPDWNRVALGTLHLTGSQSYPPNSILRIAGRGPYLSMSDLEPQLYELPILYACFSLLGKEESIRIRDDRMAAATAESAHQPGQLTMTSEFFKKRFDEELDKVRRRGHGQRKRFITTYEKVGYGI